MRRAVGFDASAALLERVDPLSSLAGQPSLLEGIRRIYGEALSPAAVVDRIIDDVRARGDEGIAFHTRAISGIDVPSLEVPPDVIAASTKRLEPALVAALTIAAGRIREYHEAFAITAGNRFVDRELGRRVLPLERVGLYVPGGRYSYPSSVLMSAIPARVAGVNEVIVVTPPNSAGEVAAATLAACAIAGVDRVFAVGGAQAIAALAYGTASVPRVDKICGPGNVFVTLAKKKVFGSVAIDGLAGPSEVFIIADATASSAYCAADMLAQAEHDPEAVVALVTDSGTLADAVEREVISQLKDLGSPEAVVEAVERGIIAVVDSLDEAVDLCNRFGPEHLEILTLRPRDYLDRIRNAG
ncbi:MAG: histidinol dehydrogenase, partial [Coriobacteriia bacterium]|nr:histidinol dehydrogenase [Coriobacteriia bacterium]